MARTAALRIVLNMSFPLRPPCGGRFGRRFGAVPGGLDGGLRFHAASSPLASVRPLYRTEAPHAPICCTHVGHGAGCTDAWVLVDRPTPSGIFTLQPRRFRPSGFFYPVGERLDE